MALGQQPEPWPAMVLYFIPSAPSHTVAESGIFDAAGGGTPLNRTVYPASQRIVHSIFVDFYSLSIALYLSSV